MTVRRISRTFSLLAALLLGAACAVLMACGGSGSDDLIPDQQAATMIDQLDAIQSAVARGRCSGVDNEVAALQGQINDLSGGVNARLRARLQQGVNNLADVAPGTCLERQQTATQTITTPTTTTETTPTETTTTETTTTPTDTVPTTPETVPTTPETTPTIPQTTPTTPQGGATVPDDAGGDVGGATPGTP